MFKVGGKRSLAYKSALYMIGNDCQGSAVLKDKWRKPEANGILFHFLSWRWEIFQSSQLIIEERSCKSGRCVVMSMCVCLCVCMCAFMYISRCRKLSQMACNHWSCYLNIGAPILLQVVLLMSEGDITKMFLKFFISCKLMVLSTNYIHSLTRLWQEKPNGSLFLFKIVTLFSVLYWC